MVRTFKTSDKEFMRLKFAISADDWFGMKKPKTLLDPLPVV